jgi:hypothetical protein
MPPKARGEKVTASKIAVRAASSILLPGMARLDHPYLFWPGLLVIGIAMRSRFFKPLRRRFATPSTREAEA